MNRLLHIKLRTILGIACLVICILPTTQNVGKSTAAAAESDSVSGSRASDWDSLPLSDVALINTYISHIREASQAYYAQRGEEIPVISWYYITLKEMTADSRAINPTVELTFSLVPYTGAHDPVGVDEVTFSASYTGQVTLLHYARTEDFVDEK